MVLLFSECLIINVYRHNLQGHLYLILFCLKSFKLGLFGKTTSIPSNTFIFPFTFTWAVLLMPGSITKFANSWLRGGWPKQIVLILNYLHRTGYGFSQFNYMDQWMKLFGCAGKSNMETYSAAFMNDVPWWADEPHKCSITKKMTGYL